MSTCSGTSQNTEGLPTPTSSEVFPNQALRGRTQLAQEEDQDQQRFQEEKEVTPKKASVQSRWQT